ncbi:acyl-CoA dehydrogenase [Desulfosporosinus orientis DSM 765]|uniref:Acyl-CoA dehydrogenase n=1 Tax=Desulfosporosinus orientis (strain ATCC 19365 / DSM 765 / NCIMB 8382 / VKM B-1628 / Singapore I) TaxID=768706 RepID=G7WGR1_DESOD|nr:acyl-CoA dehydrogenase [Desulfosporosinus orientis]AET68497.1 acyl-CoA dehydrogenase [Desulfosporosinus orientis DSM 765]
MEFKYNVRDLKFILKEWLPTEEVFACKRFKDYYGMDEIDPILTEGYKVAKEMVVPINAEGDKNPVKFENGVVTNPPGYREVFQFIQKNGWGSSSECVEVEGGMPLVLYKAVAEMISAACPAMGSNVKLTSGAANLILTFGTETDKKRFIPKMLTGEWQGTMNLTEPSAGSDVGDALARSYPTDDPRIYKIKGTKMFITAGDGSLCDNVIHMVLARPVGGAKGSSGLGLYIVPKIWVNDDGSLGKPNDVTTIAIEHKTGLNGSATCMLNYGENDECYGIMVGSPPDEKGRSKGLAMMFNMMNESRIGTGHNANNQAAAAYALASQYAAERIQGYKSGERVPIIKHSDVRRMLLDMKAHTEGIRAMIFKGFYFLDIAENSEDKAKAKDYADFAAILTPIIKCYGSESTVLMTAEAIQVLGGVGYTKEYPVEQYFRDSKVLTIWEGTSFIHGNDLVGRKMTMEKAEPFKKWMATIKAFIDANHGASGLEKEMETLDKAYKAAEEVKEIIYAWQAEKDKKGELVNVYAIRALFVFAQLYVAMCLIEQAIIAVRTLNGLPADHYEVNFYTGKIASAKYYVNNSLPNVFTLAGIIKNADTTVLEVPEDILIVN